MERFSGELGQNSGTMPANFERHIDQGWSVFDRARATSADAVGRVRRISGVLDKTRERLAKSGAMPPELERSQQFPAKVAQLWRLRRGGLHRYSFLEEQT